jgi:predicted alpha-1,6-mannanase (GH76 family)
MALALLRADDLGAGTIGVARRLQAEIMRGENDSHGGGVAWCVARPRYKNVPATGPAAILAARLHRREGRAGDLAAAERLIAWMHAVLVDPVTGDVWDGIGRLGDDRVDRDWRFTYTYGLVLGADHELALARDGDPALEARARRTAAVALAGFAPEGVIAEPGTGDGALFPGILARHLAALGDPAADAVIARSAEAAWDRRDAAGRMGPGPPVELSAHLSGLALVELAARRASGRPGPA